MQSVRIGLRKAFIITWTVMGATLWAVLPVWASTSTTLTLTSGSGDAVTINLSAKANSKIQLSYLPAGAATLQTVVLGSTDADGHHTTSLSSGGYGIPQGSPVFASVAGVQSSMGLWPSYTSSLSLSKNSLQLAVGQSFSVSGSSTLILSANSNTAGIATALSGSKVTITGLTSGSGTVTVCAVNAGCQSIAVEVGAQSGQTQIIFSPENPVMNVGESKTIVILGGGTNGYIFSSNSKPNVVDAKLSGSLRSLALYGSSAGSSNIIMCSVDIPSNCSTLSVTVFDTTAQSLSFTPSSLTLVPGVSQQVTVSGESTNQYYISSNSNSSVAAVVLNGAILTVAGGAAAGTTTITVCSATTNNRCGTLTVTLNLASTEGSSTALGFSQNVVVVPQDESTTVTVTGGGSSGYSVASNSNPSAVTATIAGSGKVVNLRGNAVGSSVVGICSATVGSTCASIYVTVSAGLPTIVLSPSSSALTKGSKILVAVSGGSSTTTIFSNTNPGVASAALSGDGKGIVVTGGTTAGNTTITICPTDAMTSKCVAFIASNNQADATPASPITIGIQLLKADGDPRVFVIADGKKQWIRTEAEFLGAGYKWSNVRAASAAVLASYPEIPSSAVPEQSRLTVSKIKISGTPALNVRQSNTVKSKAIGTVKKDQVLTVLEIKDGWYKVQHSKSAAGWISAYYTTKQ
ncbi:SH3 domain-containing protein [Candidatus Uhrbacteria bacterium]|nr:SH3 domain-containing protein [Candidatus Uhrbacteria bacterium]